MYKRRKKKNTFLDLDFLKELTKNMLFITNYMNNEEEEEEYYYFFQVLCYPLNSNPPRMNDTTALEPFFHLI